MALVAYDSSDTSDVDDELSSNTIIVTPSANEKCSQRLPDTSKHALRDCESSTQALQNLFQTLPKPAQNKMAEEEDDAFLHKKESLKKAKIAIPSLSEFKDIEDGGPSVKKYSQGNERKSGLLSILPEPKFSGNSNKKPSKPLIPNVVERKLVNVNPSPSIKKPESTKAKLKNCGNAILSADYSDSDDDDNDKSYTGKDFFSIDSQQEQIIPEDTNNGSVKNQYNYIAAGSSEPMRESRFKNIMYSTEADLAIVNLASSTSSEETREYTERIETKPNSSNDLQLDDEAIRQLCGSRKRHRKEDIQLINVDQKQVLSDSREWLVKGLMDDTSKRVSASKRRGNEPTSQQKRKHQITYLAHQAKANEAELQNQWANNRVSKRQTQSKYGF